MSASIKVLNMRATYIGEPALVVNTCCNNPDDWQNDLSPFKPQPCELYNGIVAQNMENGWQFAKVYSKHADIDDASPLPEYWLWANEGWRNPRAIRYPMGRGAKPLYSLWGGEKLDYVAARKKIYAPLYIRSIVNSPGFQHLREQMKSERVIVLRDFDGYDHQKPENEMSLTDVLNNPHKKMGHSFVIKMLLTDDIALKQIKL